MAALGFAFTVLAEENAGVADEANASSSLVVAESNGSLDYLASETNASDEANIGEGKAKAYVIPVRDQIGGPILDILRRGLKNAIRAEATTVILDMNTPGGELGVTLEIMQEIIESFERLVNGEFDELPEQAFYMVGDINEAVDQAKKMGH